MMRRRNSVRLSLVAALAVAFVALLAPHSALAQNVSKTAMAGPYSVTLKVLPAEGFMGANAPMVRDGGAKPETVDGPMHPNHHMVVFIKKDDKPVEHARVKIWYRMAMKKDMDSGMMGNSTKSDMGNMGKMSKKMMAKECKWMKLPVVRMHVKGKGLETTHFGNNVMLKPGNYDVKVKVDGKTAMFHFSL